MEVKIDTLPELGTKAAAVAAIESQIFRAIGAKDLEPVQLRYWLDAYYQARKAAELQEFYDLADRIYREDETPYQPAAPALYDKAGIRASQDAAYLDFTKYMKAVIQKAAKAAGIELMEEEAAEEPPHQSPPATASSQGKVMKAEGGPEAAAETQQTAEPAAKPQRQRPVGWDNGKLPEDPETYSGAAAAAKFKREQFDRLQAFLRGGGSMRAIVEEANGGISEDQILGIRECKRVPVAVYRVLAGVLDRLET